MNDTMEVFDRRAVRRHRDRAAERFGAFDYLFREVADRLADRLDDIRRDFPVALDLGAHGGVLRGVLGGRGGIETLVETDLSPAMAALAARTGSPLALGADEEALPFADASFDLVLSCLSLHWVNDLPGTLVQIRRALKPDGLLLAALPGGDTLFELRRAFLEAESEIEGGASPHAAPLADVREMGGLLQRAGFALPVIDSDTITVTYSDMFALMHDLRGMGETNGSLSRRRSATRRATMFAAAERYTELYGDRDNEGRIPATFQILTLTAWAPDAAQPKPLRPGSAGARLADALGVDEKPAGEKAAPAGKEGED
jgi:SAM-dependent methyltransferase